MRHAWRSPTSWLLLAVVVGDGRAWRSNSELGWLTAATFTLAALALVLLSASVTASTAKLLTGALVGFAGLQAGWMVLQVCRGVAPLGLSEGPRYGAALVAVAAPLAPLSVLPLLLAGLAVSQSYLAVTAALVGLAMAHRARHPMIGLLSVAWGAGALLVFTAIRPAPMLASRIETWRDFAWPHYAQQPLLGLGFGGWGTTVPWHQFALSTSGPGWFGHAHSDLVEWIYETGLVGLALLVGFLVAAWRAFRVSPVRPALVVIALLALGFHVFHSLFLLPWLTLIVGIGLAGRLADA